MDDPRAWQLRDDVCLMAQEAVESVAGMDHPQAWRLRERCVDVWPGAAVRSLGPLALTPRGQTLLERQLVKHGGNLGVIRFAAGVALGIAT
jgi:dTMP kinase